MDDLQQCQELGQQLRVDSVRAAAGSLGDQRYKTIRRSSSSGAATGTGRLASGSG